MDDSDFVVKELPSVENLFFSAQMLELLMDYDGWRMVSSLFPPDTRPVRHAAHEEWMARHQDRHPHREILFSLSGKGLYGFDGKAYPCNPGTVFLFDSYEPHDNSYPPHAPRGTHLWISLLAEKAVARILDVNGDRFPARHSFIIGDSGFIHLAVNLKGS